MSTAEPTGPPPLLGCGRPVSWLVPLVTENAAARGADAAHLDSCPHCQAELAEMRARWAAVRLAAAAPVRVPAHLVDTVLGSVRTLRRGAAAGRLELRSAQGSTSVDESTVLLWGRRLAQDVGAAVPECRVRAVSGDVARLRVRVAVAYRQSAARAAAVLRAGCQAELDRVFGPAAPTVDVLVDDVVLSSESAHGAGRGRRPTSRP